MRSNGTIPTQAKIGLEWGTPIGSAEDAVLRMTSRNTFTGNNITVNHMSS
jgi:hypothetical protein